MDPTSLFRRAVSSGRCTEGLVEGLAWSLPSEGPSWACVETEGDGVAVGPMGELELVGSANVDTVHLPLPGLGIVEDFSFDVDARLALRPGGYSVQALRWAPSAGEVTKCAGAPKPWSANAVCDFLEDNAKGLELRARCTTIQRCWCWTKPQVRSIPKLSTA